MSDSPSPPPPPDYVGAAQAQGSSNLEAAVASGQINNPTVVNPYGTQRVTWSPGVGGHMTVPLITQTLSPAQQELFDKSNAAKLNLANTAIGSSANIKDLLSGKLDFSGLPSAPISAGQRRDDVIKALMSRVDTDTAGQRDSRNSELIAAGIRPGTRAYEAAMTQIDRQYNDARNNAILAGGQESTRDFGMDSQARQQALAEYMAQRQTPLNELNATLSGSQIVNPFAGDLGYQAGANVGAAPIANAITNQGQAAQNLYNAQQSQYNAKIGAGAGLIGSLGSALI